MESVYQGLTSVGQCRLWPNTAKHVMTKKREDLGEHINLQRASQAHTRDKSVVCSIVLSLARSPWRTEGATAQGPGQYQSWGQYQDQRQKLLSQRYSSSTWGPASRVIGPIPNIRDWGFMINDPQAIAKLAQRMSTCQIKVREGARGLRDFTRVYKIQWPMHLASLLAWITGWLSFWKKSPRK